MPRAARKKSRSGIYHIILRGINRQSIFEDDEDREKLIQTLIRYKDKCRYNIYAFCIMGNHLHLLLKVNEEPLEQIIRRIAGSYVYWYNWKYDRIGNLFQDRFKSEPVDDDAYFLTVLRYIHQNPIKAGITKEIKNYKWSSYKEYLEGNELTDRGYVLSLFHRDPSMALNAFVKYLNTLNEDRCLEINENKKKLKDDDLRDVIYNTYKQNSYLSDGLFNPQLKG